MNSIQKSKIALTCKTYGKVISTTLSESQVMASFFIHFLYCQEFKQEAISPFPHKFTVDMFSKQTIGLVFFRSWCKHKGNFLTSMPF